MDATQSPGHDDTTPAAPAAPARSGLVGRLLRFLLVIALLVAAYLVFAPSPIDPVAYQPPPKPELVGPLAPNDRLAQAALLVQGQVTGPEDVYVDKAGNVYSGLLDGRVIRVLPDGKLETITNTGGRPLGMELDAQGALIVADGVKGLLRISLGDPPHIEVLTTTVGDVPFGFTDDLAIASDGTVYFSDASDKFGENEYLYDLLEAQPHGRLLRYDPRTKETKALLDGLYFANGVALSQNEDFLVINETYRYRMQRYWLKGEKAGTAEMFIENLPGFPDNVSSNGSGTFWLALFTVRNDTMDRLHPYPWAKSVMSKLPKALWPKPEPYGIVLSLDETGKITGSLQDPSGEKLNTITSAFERDGNLYLGSLLNDRIGKLKLP